VEVKVKVDLQMGTSGSGDNLLVGQGVLILKQIAEHISMKLSH